MKVSLIASKSEREKKEWIRWWIHRKTSQETIQLRIEEMENDSEEKNNVEWNGELLSNGEADVRGRVKQGYKTFLNNKNSFIKKKVWMRSKNVFDKSVIPTSV